MKRPLFSAGMVVFLLTIITFSDVGWGKYVFNITPGMAVNELYDDNIYLAPDHETSDYITTVSPSISLGLAGRHSNLELTYAPTFVRYDDEDQNNTTRHLGNLAFDQQLGRHLRLELSDTFIQSEEPLEETEGIIGVRQTRNKYWRNTGRAALSYQFGRENSFALGYEQSNLENDDYGVDDGRIINPFGTLTLWLTHSSGFELTYRYTKADFWRERGIAGDDYNGNGATIRYMHRFTRHAMGYVGYEYNDRDFDGTTEDYKVHEGFMGWEQSLSPTFDITLRVGYFNQANEISDDEDGFSYGANLTKRFRRGTISLGGEGGWNEAYLEAERRGFTRYWSTRARFDYQLLEPLGLFVGGSYRQDKDPTNREWTTTSANGGLRFTFLRWFSAGIEYEYINRDDDVDADDYTANRIMLILTVTRAFRL